MADREERVKHVANIIRDAWPHRMSRAAAETIDRYYMGLLDTPDQDEFLTASKLEAKYQVMTWHAEDQSKTDSDWFWLVGYLVGKAFHDIRGKRVHHLTAAAAALANWHAAAKARGETMPEERGDQKDHTGRLSDYPQDKVDWALG